MMFLAKQITKFGLVGLLGTFVHYAFLIVGVDVFKQSVLLCSSIGFVLGAMVNHHFNRRFTFDSEKTYMQTFIQFMVSASGLFVLNLLFMFLLVEWAKIQYFIAQIITTGIVFLSGFIINKFIVFKH